MIGSNGETVKDPYLMAEMLKKKYDSTFSESDSSFVLNERGEDNDEDKDKNEEDENKNEEDKENENEDKNEDDEDENEEDKENEDEGGEQEEGRERQEEDKPKLTDVGFDYMDIVDAIGQLDLCSGPGPDGISAILLKKAKISIAVMLRNIFQHSLDKSEIPDILKLGFICPILKPNSSREKPASWRPVSLTSHVIKTFERVIRRQIVNHLESNNLMDRDQHGSRRGRSCLSQLLEHQDEILRILEEGNNVDVVYTDFEKAYEKVDHRKLVQKMKSQFGIEGKIGKWLQCFFRKKKATNHY